MRVLFAVDGSSGCWEGVAQVGPLLVPERDEVTLYCSPPDMRLRQGAAALELLPAVQHAFAEAIFGEAIKRLPPSWQSRAKRIVGMQDARHGVLAAAEQARADLIVVGARGLNRLERLVLGSVSRTVVRRSRIPVWLARPRSKGEPTEHRILLACEKIENARRPFQVLADFAWPAQTTSIVLTVLPSIFAGQVPDWLQQQARSPDVEDIVRRWACEHDDEVRSTRAGLEALVSKLPGIFAKTKPLVAEGDPAEQILAAVEREHANLIVVGVQPKHHRTELFGSTSEAILNHAGCSILVVPHPETP